METIMETIYEEWEKLTFLQKTVWIMKEAIIIGVLATAGILIGTTVTIALITPFLSLPVF